MRTGDHNEIPKTENAQEDKSKFGNELAMCLVPLAIVLSLIANPWMGAMIRRPGLAVLIIPFSIFTLGPIYLMLLYGCVTWFGWMRDKQWKRRQRIVDDAIRAQTCMGLAFMNGQESENERTKPYRQRENRRKAWSKRILERKRMTREESNL